MRFHKIRPGKFKMGAAQVETEITEPFAMLSTPVTQRMWIGIKVAMGEGDLERLNPSNFTEGNGSEVLRINELSIPCRPNHPLESVSWIDVYQFIEDLNHLSAQGGEQVQRQLQQVFPDHTAGSRYDLPTEAQWEFVMRNRGLANKHFFDRNDLNEIRDFAWFSENSSNNSHAVATRKPRMIDGQPFYDLEGNVWEWMKDWYAPTITGGQDPKGPPSGTTRVIRGGSWFYSEQHLSANDRSFYKPDDRYSNIGFRLIKDR